MNRAISTGLATGIVVAGVVATAACGGGNPEQVERSSLEAPAATTEVTPSPTLDRSDRGAENGGDDRDDGTEGPDGRYDAAKVTAFVAAFRGGYPQLATDRDDEDIAEIATESCDDLANGRDPQEVTSSLVERTENDGNAATPEQAQQIFELVTPVCS